MVRTQGRTKLFIALCLKKNKGEKEDVPYLLRLYDSQKESFYKRNYTFFFHILISKGEDFLILFQVDKEINGEIPF